MQELNTFIPSKDSSTGNFRWERKTEIFLKFFIFHLINKGCSHHLDPPSKASDPACCPDPSSLFQQAASDHQHILDRIHPNPSLDGEQLQPAGQQEAEQPQGECSFL